MEVKVLDRKTQSGFGGGVGSGTSRIRVPSGTSRIPVPLWSHMTQVPTAPGLLRLVARVQDLTQRESAVIMRLGDG